MEARSAHVEWSPRRRERCVFRLQHGLLAACLFTSRCCARTRAGVYVCAWAGQACDKQERVRGRKERGARTQRCGTCTAAPSRESERAPRAVSAAIALTERTVSLPTLHVGLESARLPNELWGANEVTLAHACVACAVRMECRLRAAEYEAVRGLVSVPSCVFPDLDAVLVAHPG